MIRDQRKPRGKTTIVLALQKQASVAGNDGASLMDIPPRSEQPASSTPAKPSGHKASRWVTKVAGIVALIAVVAAVVAPRLVRQSQAGTPEGPEQTAARRVNVARPERAAVGELPLPATLQAYQQTDLYGRVNGYLKRWTVDIGARVKVGQVLAEIDTPELDQELEQTVALLGQGRSELEQARAELEEGKSEVQLADANVVRAKAHLEFASAQTERARRLIVRGGGVISREEYDSTQRDRDTRIAELSASQAELRRRTTNLATRAAVIKSREAAVKTREANVQRLRELQGFKKIVAPFDGVVTRRFAEVGMLVNAGGATGTQPLFSVAQVSILRVQVNVPQTYTGSVHEGEKVAVTIPERPGQTFFARVARTANAVDPASRTLRVEMELPNPDGTLLPGAYAQLKLTARQSDATLLVPASVLLMRSNGPHVAVIEDEVIQLRKVTLGRDLGKQAEIVQGLSGSESLVVNPTDDLRSGQRVQVAAASQVSVSRH